MQLTNLFESHQKEFVNTGQTHLSEGFRSGSGRTRCLCLYLDHEFSNFFGYGSRSKKKSVESTLKVFIRRKLKNYD